MTRHEVRLEIDSKSDAHSVRLLVDQLYDTAREEFREPGGAEESPKEMLQEFAALRDAARRQSTGSLTIIYEEDE